MLFNQVDLGLSCQVLGVSLKGLNIYSQEDQVMTKALEERQVNA